MSAQRSLSQLVVHKTDRDQFDNVPAELQSTISELLSAYEMAYDVQREPWDFAVGIEALRQIGSTESNLRWMICRGMIEHARDLTQPSDTQRNLVITPALSFSAESCFVLSEDFAQELARSSGSTNWSVLSPNLAAVYPLQPLPEWKAGRRELWLGNSLVKQFRWPAKNQELVLATFEEEGWPAEGVFDPMPQDCDKEPKQRLRDTIKCLNRSHDHALIRFRGDGTGERVIWELTDLATSRATSSSRVVEHTNVRGDSELV